MKAQGKKTDLTGAKESRKDETDGLTNAFENLDLQLKNEDKMEE